MNFLKRLASLFSGGGGAPRGDKRYLNIYVLSRRCNEPVSGQVDLLNELSGSDEGDYAYHTRKVLHTSGERRCFSEVEINLYFSQDKQIIRHEVSGGRWLTSEEYATELARFNAPPEEESQEAVITPIPGAGATVTPEHNTADNTADNAADKTANNKPNPKENDNAKSDYA